MKNPDAVSPLLYVSFDQVPAAKGASTHIEANARALGQRFGSVILTTPGPVDQPVRSFAEGVRQLVLGCPDPDVLGRVFTFRAKLRALLARQSFDVIQFRSIFEGYPLARTRERLGALLVYEVNALPSIEMKYSHPRLHGDDRLRAKLIHQEDACLKAADRVVTISEMTRDLLIRRGCDPGRIVLIRNGVDERLFDYRDPLPVESGPLRILYSGTLSTWQGVGTLVDALPLVALERPVVLTLVGPAPRARKDELIRRIRRLGTDRVRWHGTAEQHEVASLLHEHHVCVVPLANVDRNTVQGCCPLKLLEAFASGCPVIASNLAVVRELAEPEQHFVPVPPDDPAGLALALWRVATGQEDNVSRARRARAHVEASHTWERSTGQLVKVYEELLDRVKA